MAIKQLSTLISFYLSPSSSSLSLTTTTTAIAATSNLLFVSLLLSTFPQRYTILSIFKSSIFKSSVFIDKYNYRFLYNHHRYNNHHHLYKHHHTTTHKEYYDQMIESIEINSNTNNYHDGDHYHDNDDVKTDRRHNIQSVVLDKEMFNTTINLVALRIPIKSCNAFLKELHNYTYDRPKIKRIYPIANHLEHKLLILSTKITDLSLQQLPLEKQKFISEYHDNVTSELFQLSLHYEDYSVDEVLRSIIQFDSNNDGSSSSNIDNNNNEEHIVGPPGSFEQAGHLAHLNLRSEFLPYKKIIGQVILDKNRAIKTVVNKIGNIENEFRTFPMELLAGEDNYEVQLKQCNATFRFDFRTVYWNSRLQAEHKRICDLISISTKSFLFNCHNDHIPLSETASYQLSSCSTTTVTTTTTTTGGSNKPDIIDTDPTTTLINTNPSNNYQVCTTSPVAKTTHNQRNCVYGIADMMAGIGPFAIPLAMMDDNNYDDNDHDYHKDQNKNKATRNNAKRHKTHHNSTSSSNSSSSSHVKHGEMHVYANDLNPESYKYLVMNSEENFCGSKLTAHNMCGRQFILKLLEENKPFYEVIMNLPSTATNFLDVFIGMKTRLGDERFQQWYGLPRIHVYAFSTVVADPIGDIINRVAGVLLCSPQEIREGISKLTDDYNVVDRRKLTVENVNNDDNNNKHYCKGFIVRDVAPSKLMICLSFKLPLSVAEAKPIV